jgi:hypothetical protein
MPGVNVQFSLREDGREDHYDPTTNQVAAQLAQGSQPALNQNDQRQLQRLSEQLFPYLKQLFLQEGTRSDDDAEGRRYTRRPKSPRLPFKG